MAKPSALLQALLRSKLLKPFVRCQLLGSLPLRSYLLLSGTPLAQHPDDHQDQVGKGQHQDNRFGHGQSLVFPVSLSHYDPPFFFPLRQDFALLIVHTIPCYTVPKYWRQER